MAHAFDLDRVLLIVSAHPPHKDADAAAAPEHRLAMLRAAVAGDPLLEASDLELRREGPSWTVDTLHELRAGFAGAQLFLILGIDAWEEIDTWSRPAEIPALANVIVTTRPGRDFPHGAPEPPVAARPDACYDPAIGAHVHTSGHVIRGHRIRGIEASATDIRRRVRLGLPFEHLTGPAVARFIREHGLYLGSDASSRHDHSDPGAGKH